MSDEFRTIAGESAASTRVEGSRFLAVASPVESREEAEEWILRRRRKFHDATHHCFAYRIGPEGDEVRQSDDGEPSGTGGKPILGAIDRFGLTNLLLIVTRYFGGTKLGTGGLARAYAEAAEEALKSAVVIVRHRTGTLTVVFPHEQTGRVMHVVSRLGAGIEDTAYDEEVHLRIRIRKSMLEELRKELVSATSGNVRVAGERDRA
jgi:uncharacterized YigZ family protein